MDSFMHGTEACGAGFVHSNFCFVLGYYAFKFDFKNLCVIHDEREVDEQINYLRFEECPARPKEQFYNEGPSVFGDAMEENIRFSMQGNDIREQLHQSRIG